MKTIKEILKENNANFENGVEFYILNIGLYENVAFYPTFSKSPYTLSKEINPYEYDDYKFHYIITKQTDLTDLDNKIKIDADNDKNAFRLSYLFHRPIKSANGIKKYINSIKNILDKNNSPLKPNFETIDELDPFELNKIDAISFIEIINKVNSIYCEHDFEYKIILFYTLMKISSNIVENIPDDLSYKKVYRKEIFDCKIENTHVLLFNFNYNINSEDIGKTKEYYVYGEKREYKLTDLKIGWVKQDSEESRSEIRFLNTDIPHNSSKEVFFIGDDGFVLGEYDYIHFKNGDEIGKIRDER